MSQVHAGRSNLALSPVVVAAALFFGSSASAQIDRQTTIERLSPVTSSTVNVPTPIGVDADVYCSGWLGEDREPFAGSIVNAEKVGNQRSFVEGDIVYVDLGAEQGMTPGLEFTVVRPDKQVFAPDSVTDLLGRLYVTPARLRVICVLERSSMAEIVSSCREVEIGDLLLPFEPIPIPLVRRTKPLTACDPASNKAGGRIVATLDRATFVTGETIVYLDLGEDMGVGPGDYLTVYRNPLSADVLRTVLGEVAILKTTKRSAVAKVTVLRDTMGVGDLVELK